jgi:hypothetical protein
MRAKRIVVAGHHEPTAVLPISCPRREWPGPLGEAREALVVPKRRYVAGYDNHVWILRRYLLCEGVEQLGGGYVNINKVCLRYPGESMPNTLREFTQSDG